MMGPEEALIFPPPGGPEIVAVVGRTYSNAVQQEVILRSNAATPGQNYIKVVFFGVQRPEDRNMDSLSDSGLRASSIARDMRAAFPGLDMVSSGEFLQNNYGAFSYASGRGEGDDTCLFGWQQIRSPQDAQQGFMNFGRINVILRLCQSGVAVEQLLSVMYNYTVTGSYSQPGWNPYGISPQPNAGVGATGYPVYPKASDTVPMLPGSQAPVVRPATVYRPPAGSPAPAPVVARPVAGQPVVMQPGIARPVAAMQPATVMRPVTVKPPVLAAPVAAAQPGAAPIMIPAPPIAGKTVPAVTEIGSSAPVSPAIPAPGCAAERRDGQRCR